MEKCIIIFHPKISTMSATNHSLV